MPWILPHGVDDDPIFHHGVEAYSPAPALCMGRTPDGAHLQQLQDLLLPGTTLVHVATGYGGVFTNVLPYLALLLQRATEANTSSLWSLVSLLVGPKTPRILQLQS